jgi:hypothetical protein
MSEHSQTTVFKVQDALVNNTGHKEIICTYRDEKGRFTSDFYFIVNWGQRIKVAVSILEDGNEASTFRDPK